MNGEASVYRSGMPSHDAETDRIRSIYDRRAAAGKDEASQSVRARSRGLFKLAEGDVLEVGVGRGGTFAAYPAGIRLSGIELSPVALAGARRRAAQLGIAADLVEGDATALPYPDERFDTVVFSFVLCTVPDDRLAVAEAVRVLRPGGRLLLAEHVRSPNLLVRLGEYAFEPIVRWREADHLLREPLDHVRAEGLEIERVERSWFGILEQVVARKPAR